MWLLMSTQWKRTLYIKTDSNLMAVLHNLSVKVLYKIHCISEVLLLSTSKDTLLAIHCYCTSTGSNSILTLDHIRMALYYLIRWSHISIDLLFRQPISSVLYKLWCWFYNGVACIFLGYERMTSETGVYIDRYDIHRLCWRSFASLYAVNIY